MLPRRASDHRGERVVLLLSEGPQVPEQREAEQSHARWILESHRNGQADLLFWRKQVHRLEEVARLLQRKSRKGAQNGLDDARIQAPFAYWFSAAQEASGQQHFSKCKSEKRDILNTTIFIPLALNWRNFHTEMHCPCPMNRTPGLSVRSLRKQIPRHKEHYLIHGFLYYPSLVNRKMYLLPHKLQRSISLLPRTQNP